MRTAHGLSNRNCCQCNHEKRERIHLARNGVKLMQNAFWGWQRLPAFDSQE